MTDNEKAATFIGWSPTDWCKAIHWHYEQGFAVCETCDFNSQKKQIRHPMPEHRSPAPDMADPRNYMKALENLAQAGKDSGSMEAALTRTIVNRDGGEIVAWLAALYDAEHAT